MKHIDESYFNVAEDVKYSKPEELLSSGEKILWKGKPKKFSYVMSKSIGMMPIALLWGLIDISIIFTVIAAGAFEGGGIFMIAFLIGFFALHLMPVWIWIGSMVKASKEMNSIQYMITNKRIIEFKGKDNLYVSTEINLVDITGATLKTSAIDKMLKVGDIYISSRKSKVLVLFDIPNSQFICSRIQQLYNISETSGIKRTAFYSNNHECSHCGSYYDASKNKCPSCGAPTER